MAGGTLGRFSELYDMGGAPAFLILFLFCKGAVLHLNSTSEAFVKALLKAQSHLRCRVLQGEFSSKLYY